VQSDQLRRRSLGFLDRGEEQWACFLVTFQSGPGAWRGFFAFRSGESDREEEEIRTAEIFLEDSEAEIDRKARGLGRPLLSGLLSSALHTRERESREPPVLQGWFRDTLRRGARDGSEPWPEITDSDRTLGELRSLYDSYRIDQMVHLINLLEPEHFQEAVDRILDGRAFDFSTRDRLQFAMMVVDHLERLLPLPPFEVWAEDYLANPHAYRLYARALYREGICD